MALNKQKTDAAAERGGIRSIGDKRGGWASFKRNYGGWVFALPAIILMYVFTWRPIVIGMSWSLFDLKGLTPERFVGLKNFKDALGDTNFVSTLWNTVRYVGWRILFFPFPIVLAVMVNEMRRGKEYFKFTMYITGLIPAVACCLLFMRVYHDSAGGLLNMFLSGFGIPQQIWLTDKDKVILLLAIKAVWQGAGGAMIMYMASLAGVDDNLYEAARLDGAKLHHRIRYVLWPHIRGLVLLMLTTTIVGAFSVTEDPMIMTGGGPNNASMMLGYQSYLYMFKYFNYERAIALDVSKFLILLVFSIAYFVADKRIND